MRRDPVTGKTFVNIVELYQMRKQANQGIDFISNNFTKPVEKRDFFPT